MRCQRCGSEQLVNARFCTRCGNNLDGQQKRIICPNCGNRTQIAPRCMHCNILWDSGNILRTIASIDMRMSGIEQLLTNLNISREDLASQAKIDISTNLVSEADLTQRDTSTEVQIPEISNITEDVDSVIEDVEEIDDFEDEVEAEFEEEIPEEVYEEPEEIQETIYVPDPLPPPITIFEPEFVVETYIDELQVPSRSHQSTTVIEITFKERAKEFLEGPLQTGIGIFALIMSLLFLPGFDQLESNVRGAIFSIVGLLVITLGFLFIEGKFPLIKNKQYGFGIFLTTVGLSISYALSLQYISEAPWLLIFVLAAFFLAGYVGYQNDSNLVLSYLTLMYLLIPLFIETESLLWNIISISVGLIWFIPMVLFVYDVGIKEKSFYPALICLAIVPSVAIAIGNNYTRDSIIFLPSLGFILGVIPVSLLMMKGKIELFPVYVKSIFVLIFTWVPIAFFAYQQNGYSSIYDNLLIFITMGVFYELATSSNSHNEYNSELIRSISIDMSRYARPAAILLGYIAVYQSLSLVEAQDTTFDFIFRVLLPVTLFILVISSYILFSNLKRFNKGSQSSTFFSLSLLEFALMAYALQIGALDDHEFLRSVFVISMIYLTLIGGLIIHSFKSKFHEIDDLLILASLGTIVNEFILTYLGLTGSWAVISAFAGYSIFLLSIKLPNLKDYERIRLNQISLFGNFVTICAIQFFSNTYIESSLSINGNLIGPAVVYLGFVISSSLSSLILHRYIVPRRFEVDGIFGLDKSRNPLFRGWAYIEKLLLKNQEVSLSAFLNLGFVIFVLSNAFDTDSILLTIFLISTPIFLAINFIARKGNWLTMIPSMIPFVQLAMLINSESSIFILQIALMTHILVSGLISRLDRKENRINQYTRAYGRGILLWSTLLSVLYYAQASHSFGIILSVLVMMSVSFLIDWYRKDFFGTGLIILAASLVLSHIPSENHINQYLGIVGVFLANLNYIFQFYRNQRLVTTEVHLPESVEGGLKYLGFGSEISSSTTISIRNVLPTLVSVFMLLPPDDLNVPVVAMFLILLNLFYILMLEASKQSIEISWFIVILQHVNTFIHASSDSTLTNWLYLTQISLLPVYFAFKFLTSETTSQNTPIISYILYAFFSPMVYLIFRDVGDFVIYYLLTLTVTYFAVFRKIGSHDLSGLPVGLLVIMAEITSISSSSITGPITYIAIAIILAFLLYGAIFSERVNSELELFSAISISLVLGFNSFIINPIIDFNQKYAELVMAITIVAIFVSFEFSHQGTLEKIVSSVMIIILGVTFTDQSLGINAQDVFPLIFIFQILRPLLRSDIRENFDPNELFTPIAFAILYFLLTDIAVEIEFAYLLFYGLLLLVLDYFKPSNRNLPYSLTYTWALILSWFIRPEFGNSEISIAILLIAGVFLVASNQVFMADYSEVNAKRSLQLTLLTSVLLDFLTHLDEIRVTGLEFIILMKIIILSIVLWRDHDNKTINRTILVMTLSLIIVSPEVLGYGLLVFSVNLGYMLFQSLFATEHKPTSRGLFLGLSTFILGLVHGSSDDVWVLLDKPEILNLIWFVNFVIWLISSNIEIITKGSTLQIFSQEGFHIKGKSDAFGYSWLSFSLLALLWFNLIAIKTIILFMVVSAMISFVIILTDKKAIITSNTTFILVMSAYITMALTSGLLISEIYTETSSFSSLNYLEFVNLLILLPLAMTIFFMGYRSRENLPIANKGWLTPMMLIATVLPLYLNLNLFNGLSGSEINSFIIPSVVVTWLYLILGSRKIVPMTTAVATISLFLQALVVGTTIEWEFGGIKAYTFAVLLMSVVMFVFVVISEARKVVNIAYEPTILITVLTQVLILFDVDKFVGDSTPIGKTVVTVLLSIIGALSYIYGTKFKRSRYTNIGNIIIYLNVIRGGYIFFSRILTGGEGDNFLSFISFLGVAIMIFVIQGFKSLSQREDLKGILKVLFEPVTEVEQ